MNESDSASNPEMELLRNLLIGEERRELDDLKRSLEDAMSAAEANRSQLAELSTQTELLQSQAADQSAFLAASADALPEALRLAGRSDPQGVSRALSPFVVTSIRKEIVNSRDEMVDALYPITGRLVAASVRNSIAKLSEDINERMNALTSMAMWRARVQAWRTGEPVSTFMLTSGGNFHVLRAMLLDRSSGVPLSVAEAEDVEERSDTNLISGLLTALSNLTEEVYTSAADELRRVDLNGRQIAFRRSASQLLVIEFVGQPAADILADVDQRFGDIVALGERENRAELDSAVGALLHLEAVQADTDAPEKPRYALWALAGVAVVLLGWALGAAFGRWQLDSAVDRMQQVIEAEPALAAYPISISADYDDSAIDVSGLLPHSASASSLLQALETASGSFSVRGRFEGVADSEALSHAEGLVAALQAENGKLRDSLNAVEQQLGGARIEDVRISLQRLTDRLKKVTTVFEGAVEQLQGAANGTKVAFENELELRDASAADADLKRLAALLLKTPEDLLIIPKRDTDGGESDRWPKARAQYVRTQLLRLGVPVSQLSISEPLAIKSAEEFGSVAFALGGEAALQ